MRRILLCIAVIPFLLAFRNEYGTGKCSCPHSYKVVRSQVVNQLLGGTWTYQYSYLYDSCFVLSDVKKAPMQFSFFILRDSLQSKDTSFLRSRKEDLFRNVGVTNINAAGVKTTAYASSPAVVTDSTLPVQMEHRAYNQPNSKAQFRYYITGIEKDTLLVLTGLMYGIKDFQAASGIYHVYVREVK